MKMKKKGKAGLELEWPQNDCAGFPNEASAKVTHFLSLFLSFLPLPLHSRQLADTAAPKFPCRSKGKNSNDFFICLITAYGEGGFPCPSDPEAGAFAQTEDIGAGCGVQEFDGVTFNSVGENVTTAMASHNNTNDLSLQRTEKQ